MYTVAVARLRLLNGTNETGPSVTQATAFSVSNLCHADPVLKVFK